MPGSTLKHVVTALTLGFLIGGCGEPSTGRVADSTYTALVPTDGQLATHHASDLPGGFLMLQDSDIGELVLTVNGDDVIVRADDGTRVAMSVVKRIQVRDSEGSGPFRGQKEVLVLDADPFAIGELTIPSPVIWPGSFEESPVITLKSRNELDSGPAVSCTSSEACLLFTSGVDPIGTYEDANNPALEENMISKIHVRATSIEFVLDTGERIETSRSGETTTQACGIAETLVWELPSGLLDQMDNPVLVQASCPTTPGDNWLIIMEREAIPLLAPVAPEFGGEWCEAGESCLLFVPTE